MIGLQLVTSFISVAERLAVQRDTTQRQLNAERKKRPDGPRVESLNSRLSTTHEQKLVIDEMMRKIFTGLFVHRYRDVDPNIRMSCIRSLGVWILSYPTLFLQDLYLKYLGWTLNDKSAGVRKAAVLALQNIYEVEDNVPTLSLFTERFSNRMIELADDVDVSVAVCAIGLVKQLLRHQLIPDDDLGSLYDLLIDDPPEIRRAIGELVYDHLIEQKFNSSQSGSKGNESEVHLGRMLQILREFSTDPILSAYVIDDVWEYMKAMKDWKCIISMLLDENPLIELTDEDATNLARLLFASVKKAVGERIVPASDNRKQYFNKAQREMFENNRRDLTVAMMKNYPLLLRKFMVDKVKISSLVEIIVYMNLELYSLKRQEQNFRNTLLLIKDAFFKHGEKDALRSCVKAITFCSTESRGELQDFSRNKLKELEDELLDKLKSATKEVIDGEDEYSLLVNLKRLFELQLSRPASIEEIYGDCITILRSFRNLDDEVS
ncbi:Sister-chromatid cohesion protein 3 [Hibiscus syriacus]|uniref:Cohesin subunit SA-3 n=1 Tax=Hibiscus syriacus TaxID=106335 RepID=A0A6A2ZPT2_HIBSY|nr:Sister-chromatid cohesion protein 3 [Hibiscus syriacus]